MKNFKRCSLEIMVPLLLLLVGSLTIQAVDRPNIVIIYVDDLGWGSPSCYGQTAYETPHLDRMAKEGARLTSFYVSTPSCGPSRAALLTGRYPFRTGVPSNPAPDGMTIIAPFEQSQL